MRNSIFAQDHHPVILDAIRVRASGESRWTFPSHAHEHAVEVTIMFDGHVVTQIEDDYYDLFPGTVLLKQDRHVHREHAVGSDDLHAISVLISGVHLEGREPLTVTAPDHVLLLPGDRMSLITELMSYIEQHHETKEIPAELIDTLLLLLHDLEQEGRFRLPRKPGKDELVQEIRGYLDDNFREKISLKMLSEYFFVSPFYMERRFTEETGTSITRYITDRRMDEAQRLLVFTDTDIKEIAEKCGYSDVHYFYKVFRASLGQTPLQLRKDRQKTVIEDSQ